MGFPFLLAWFVGAAAAAPLAFAENGGVQAASGFAGTRNATRSSRLFARNRVCRYGWKPLAARRGEVTPKRWPRRRPKQALRRQAGIVREGSSPDGRDRALVTPKLRRRRTARARGGRSFLRPTRAWPRRSTAKTGTRPSVSSWCYRIMGGYGSEYGGVQKNEQV